MAACKRPQSQNSVEVIESFGEFFVRVVEDGHATSLSFNLESFAQAYAAGQRVRLGLIEPSITPSAQLDHDPPRT